MKQLAHLFALTFSFLLTSQVIAQESTISGYIQDAATGEMLIGANVLDTLSLKGTTSNTYGFFSLTLEQESAHLRISYVGYADTHLDFSSLKDTLVYIQLNPSATIDEIEITASKSYRIEEETQMSTIEIPIQQLKNVPALLGEVDILKALQLLPGVQSGGEGQSGLYVRGGSPDQNLILLDGVPVYNASHLFGFFSVFNADAVKDVRLIKGGFPARYGGRLSSVLEINMKEGNNQEFHGSGSIGLVSSKLTLEGPINQGKTSFIVSGRRTYIDLLTRPLIKKSFDEDGEEGITGYYFYDVNAKVNHTFSPKDRLYLSVYLGNDRFYANIKDKLGEARDFSNNDLGWGNITTALRWNHLITDKLFANTTLTYSNYNLDTKAAFGTIYSPENLIDEASLEYSSGIRDYALNIDLDYLPNPDHFIRMGLRAIHHEFKPGTFLLSESDPFVESYFETEISQENVMAQEYAAYIEDDMVFFDELKVNAGLHFSGFSANSTFYSSLQPRVSARYILPNEIALKASFATMQQYIHLLAYDGIGLPTDLWLPTTDRIEPQKCWQAAMGAAKTLDQNFEISLEAYYKKTKNVMSYKEGSGLFEVSDWQDRVIQGDGESYGVELFLQKKKGRFNGWIGYTLSWTKRQFDELNFGREFPYRYDRRHDISVVATYQIGPRVDFSAAWVYGTGNAVTLANANYLGAYPLNDESTYYEAAYFENRNDFRMKSYHRLDLGFNFKKEKKKYTRTWSIGAYNTYHRQNPFYIYPDTEYINNPDGTYTSKFVLKQTSLFPIIPYVTYSFKF